MAFGLGCVVHEPARPGVDNDFGSWVTWYCAVEETERGFLSQIFFLLACFWFEVRLFPFDTNRTLTSHRRGWS